MDNKGDILVKNIEILYERDYLFSFLIAFIIVGSASFFILMSAAADSNRITYDVDLNIEYVERFVEAKKNADLSVVMLANSRLRNAFRAGFAPEELVELEDGRMAAMIQYSINAAQFKDFSSLQNDILLSNPDYLVIADSVLSNNRVPMGKWVAYSKVVLFYFENFIVKNNAFEKWWEERTELPLKCNIKFNLKNMRKRIDATNIRDIHSIDLDINENLKPLRHFIRVMIEGGTKVIILNIPPNMEVINEYNVPSHVLGFYGLGYQPKPEDLLPDMHEEVMWLNYTTNLGKESYCDFVHLNQQAAPIFKEWFLREIAAWENK